MTTNQAAVAQTGHPQPGVSPTRPPVPSPRPPRRRQTPASRRAALSGMGMAAATWLALGLVVTAFLVLVVGPMTGRYRMSVVLSDSMKPHWETGDVVISTPERPEDVRVGQVISFNPPIDGRPSITHRVVRVASGGPTPVIVTKGDANAANDEWGAIKITEGPVMRVRGVVPNLGWALKFLLGRNLPILTTVLAPILLLVLLLWRIWRPTLDQRGIPA